MVSKDMHTTDWKILIEPNAHAFVLEKIIDVLQNAFLHFHLKYIFD